MRTPYLVVINNEKSFVYTDKRKLKKIFDENNNIEVYVFKKVSKYNDWNDIYRVYEDGKEIESKIFKNNGSTYSDLGCYVMEKLAKATWKSSIKYPGNGFHICHACENVTNAIASCLYCDNFICWDCSYEIYNYSEGHFCSDKCYEKYLKEKYGIENNPELEHKTDVCDRLDRILKYFEKEQLIDILIRVKYPLASEHEEEYEDTTEEELLTYLERETDNDIYVALMELYECETDQHLSDILDAEEFIDNLDPNDPADEWFFED